MINQLIQEVHTNAVRKGWWDENRGFGEIIALIHSEVSEALEDYRSGHLVNEIWYEYATNEGKVMRHGIREDHNGELGKPCGIPSELADVVIRVFDVCGRYGIDLEAAIREKMAYNATRPRRHGGKVL